MRGDTLYGTRHPDKNIIFYTQFENEKSIRERGCGGCVCFMRRNFQPRRKHVENRFYIITLKYIVFLFRQRRRGCRRQRPPFTFESTRTHTHTLFLFLSRQPTKHSAFIVKLHAFKESQCWAGSSGFSTIMLQRFSKKRFIWFHSRFFFGLVVVCVCYCWLLPAYHCRCYCYRCFLFSVAFCWSLASTCLLLTLSGGSVL